MSPFGIASREFRRGRSLLLGDVADALNVSASYISQVEHGHRPPPEDLADRIIAKFDLTGEQAAKLRAAAIESARTFEIRMRKGASKKDRALASEIALGFARMSDRQKEQIAAIIRRGDDHE